METVTFIILGLALGIIGVIAIMRLNATSAQSKPIFRRGKPENGGTRSDESLNRFPDNQSVKNRVDKDEPGSPPGTSAIANFEIGGDLGLNDLDYLGKEPHKWAPSGNSQNTAVPNFNRDLNRSTKSADTGPAGTKSTAPKPEKPAQTTSAGYGESWAPSTSKFASPEIAQTLTHAQSLQYPGELPEGYGDNQITLLARDPEWIFAYWEINYHKIQEICQRFGPDAWERGQHVLRVYDTTDLLFNGYNANHYFDIQISRFSRQWHVEVGQANRTYCIDRGLIIDNQFVVLARSNFVTTPANCVSSLIDEQWMLLNEYDRKLYQRLDQPLGGSSPHFAYSISLAEELAKMEMGVSSPLMPRPKQN
jgi:hypothetical protein